MIKKISDLEELTLDQVTEPVYGVVVVNGQNYKFDIITLIPTVTKDDIGLDRVDNTSDMEKPVSLQMKRALAGKAPNAHQHTPEDIDNLDEYIDARLPAGSSVVFVHGNW